MEDIILKQLVKNSINERLSLLTEDPDVNAEFYEQLLYKILQSKLHSFLGHLIGEIQPLSQPVGIVFARKADVKNDPQSFEIISKLVEVKTIKTIMNITAEAWEDLINLSKMTNHEDEQLPSAFVDYVQSVCGYKETIELLNYLKSEAIDFGKTLDLTQGDADVNVETNFFYINKIVNDAVLKMNFNAFYTYDAFCILPQTAVGSILSLSFANSRVDDASDINRSNYLFLGKVNNVRYYLNPDSKETQALVGLNSNIERGVSSLIYCPYNMNITTATEYNSANKALAVFSRNAYIINPLHSADNPLLFKFDVKAN